MTRFRFRWPETSRRPTDLGGLLVRTCETAGGRVFAAVVFAPVGASRRRDGPVPRAAQAGPDPGGRAGVLARAGLSARGSYRPLRGSYSRAKSSTAKMDTEREPLVIRARASPGVLREEWQGWGDGLLPKMELNCPRNPGLSWKGAWPRLVEARSDPHGGWSALFRPCSGSFRHISPTPSSPEQSMPGPSLVRGSVNEENRETPGCRANSRALRPAIL